MKITGWKRVDDRYESLPDARFAVYRDPRGGWSAVERAKEGVDRVIHRGARTAKIAKAACALLAAGEAYDRARGAARSKRCRECRGRGYVTGNGGSCHACGGTGRAP